MIFCSVLLRSGAAVLGREGQKLAEGWCSIHSFTLRCGTVGGPAPSTLGTLTWETTMVLEVRLDARTQMVCEQLCDRICCPSSEGDDFDSL